MYIKMILIRHQTQGLLSPNLRQLLLKSPMGFMLQLYKSEPCISELRFYTIIIISLTAWSQWKYLTDSYRIQGIRILIVGPHPMDRSWPAE